MKKLISLLLVLCMVLGMSVSVWAEGTDVAQIGDKTYATLELAVNDAKSGDEIKILKAGTYTVPSGKNLTITGAVDDVVFNMGESQFNTSNANLTFNNVTFNWAACGWPYHGLQHCGEMTYNDCIINGTVFLYGPSETFNDCEFNVTGDTYNVWTYGAKVVNFNGCTFNSAGKSVLVYWDQSKNEEHNIEFKNCEFVATQQVNGKAAIEIGSTHDSFKVTIDEDCTAVGFANGSVSGNSLWNVKNALGNTIQSESKNGNTTTYTFTNTSTDSNQWLGGGKDATVVVTTKDTTTPPSANPPQPPVVDPIIPDNTDDDWYEEIEEDNDTESLVVRIKFDGVDEADFEEIKVNLLRNGQKYDSEELSASKVSKKDWRFEWDNLDEDDDWSVALAAELEGYDAEVVNLRGNYWTITLTPAEVEAPVVSVDKANPETGANDFVGAAVALAVMSVLGGAALSLKK